MQVSDSRKVTTQLLSRLDRIAFIVLSVAVLIATFRMSVNRLGSAFFWWDEAGQFWMSQGQAHIFPYGQPQGSVWSGVELGRNGSNLDPLGFTVLLRVWLDMVGTSPIALRCLPFAFFLGTLALSVFIGRRLFNVPWTLALAVPAFLLYFNLPLRYAFELRAFSIELFSVLTLGSLVVAYGIRSSRTLLALIFLAAYAGIVFSRYSFVIAIGAAAFTMVAIMLFRFRRIRLKCLSKAIPVALVPLIFIAWNTGVFGGAKQGAPRSYTGSMDLAESVTPSFLVEVFLENFVRNGQLLILLFLATSFAAVFVLRSPSGSKLISSSVQGFTRDNLKAWQVAAIYVMAYEGLASLVSILGLSPWWSGGRWSIGLYALATIAGFGLVQVVGEIARAKLSTSSHATSVVILGVLLVLIPVSLLLVQKRDRLTQEAAVMLSLEQPSHPFVDLVEGTSRDLSDPEVTVWHVHPWVWPSFRMLWETDKRSDLTPAG